MKRLKLIHLLFPVLAGLLSLHSCEDSYAPATIFARMPLVIEGWIEEGEAPVVMVTRALDLNNEEASLEDAIEKWCRVTVFDNGEPFILTARKNTAYNPNIIFTSSRIKGKIGHSYRLLVETDDTVATAEACLRSSASISRLESEPSLQSDSLFSIRAFITNVDDDACYKFFCKGATDRRHFPSFLGNIEGARYDPEAGISITRGLHSAFLEDEYAFTHFFTPGELVEVKVCSLDRPVFEFWKAYDLNVSLSSNLFLSFVSDCPGNIVGAKGYWAAYGSSLRICRIPAPGITQ